MRALRDIWLGLLVSLVATITVSTQASAQKKPNVVMLMSDDVGWGDYGAVLRRRGPRASHAEY